MSFVFLLMFFSSVFLSVYLFNRHNTYLRQQNRKRSQPLPPIGNLETDSSNETYNDETKTSDGENQTPASLKDPSNWRQSVLEMRKKKQIEPALQFMQKQISSLHSIQRSNFDIKVNPTK